MKKRKFNALIAAGCLTFLAPLSAHAEEWTDLTDVTTDTTKTTTTDTTFRSIGVSGNGTKLQIQTPSGTLTATNAATTNVTLSGTAILEFSPAVESIVLGTNTDTTSANNVQINGTNYINLNSNNTQDKPALNLGSVGFDNTKETSLTLTSTTSKPKTGTAKLGSINAKLINFNGQTNKGQTLTLQGGDTNDKTTASITIDTVDVASDSVANEIIAKEYTGTVAGTDTTVAGNKTITNLKLNAGSSGTTKLTLKSNVDTSKTITGTNQLTVTNTELNDKTELTTAGNSKLTLGDVAIKGANTAIVHKNTGSTTITTVNMDAETTLKINDDTDAQALTISTINAKNAKTTNGNKLVANSSKSTTVNNINVGDATNKTVAEFTYDSAGSAENYLKNANVYENATLNLKATGENGLTQSDDSNIALTGGETNSANLVLTDKVNKITLKKVTATGTATINNNSKNSNTTLGNLNVNTYTSGSTNKASTLTVKSTESAHGTYTTNFNGANVKGVTSNSEGASTFSTLVLDSTNGAINDTAGINLNGAGQLTIQGANAVSLKNIVATNRFNKVNNNIAGTELEVKVDGTSAVSVLYVNANADTTLKGVDIQGNTSGTSSTNNALLQLNATGGNITINDALNLKGNSYLYLNPDTGKKIEISGTDKNINVINEGNVISKLGSGTADISNLVLGADDGTTEKAGLTVINTVNNAGNVNFNATGDNTNILATRNDDDSATTEFNDLVLGTSAKSATLKAQSGKASFNNATVGDGQQLTLKLDGYTDSTTKTSYTGKGITGNLVTLNGGELDVEGVADNYQRTITLGTEGNTGVKVNNQGGTVKITGNSTVTSHENENIQLNNIELSANGTTGTLTLTLDGVKTENYTGITQSSTSDTQAISTTLKNGSQLSSFAANTGQTLSTTGADTTANEIINTVAGRNVGDLNAGTSDVAGKLQLTANENTEYEDAVVYKDSTLILKAADGKSVTGTSTTLKNNSTLTLDKGTGSTINVGSLGLGEADGDSVTLNNMEANYTGFVLNANKMTVNLEDSSLTGSAAAAINKSATIQTGTSSTKASSIGELQLAGTSETPITIDLKANNENLTVASVALKGNSTLNLNKSNDAINITSADIDVTGSNNTINNSETGTLNDKNINVGGFDLYSYGIDGELIINDTESTNHGNIILGATNTEHKAKGDLTLNAENNVTYTSASAINGSTLTLNAKENNTLSTTGTTTIDNGKLNINTAEDYTGSVNVGALTLKNNVELTNVKNNDTTQNYTSLVLSDLVKATLNNSEVKDYDLTTDIAISSGKTMTFETGDSNSSSTVGNFALTGATGTDNEATLNLTSNNGTLNAGTVEMNGYSNLNVTGDSKVELNSYIASSVTGAGHTIFITGTDNKITVSNTNDETSIGGLTVGTSSTSGDPAVTTYTTGDLTLQSDAETVSGETHTAKTTKFAGASVTGDLNGTNLSTLTLNANKGNIQSTSGIGLYGNAKLVLQGNKDITLYENTGITATNSNNTIENKKTGVNLGTLNAGYHTTEGLLGVYGFDYSGNLVVNAGANIQTKNISVIGKTADNSSSLILNTDLSGTENGTITNNGTTRLNGYSTLTTQGTKEITLGDISASITNNTINVENENTTFGDISISQSGRNNASLPDSATFANTVLDINAKVKTDLKDITINRSTLNLNATGDVTADAVSLTNTKSTYGTDNSTNAELNISGTGKVTFDSLTGTDYTVTNTNANNNFGAVTANGNVTLDNVQSTNYNSLALGTDTTSLTLKKGSDVVSGAATPLNIANGQEVTITNADTETSTVGDISMTAGTAGTTPDTTKLTLAPTSGDLSISNITMSGENEVNLGEASPATTPTGTITTSATTTFNVTGNNNVINNNISGTDLNDINLGSASATTKTDGTLTINANQTTTINDITLGQTSGTNKADGNLTVNASKNLTIDGNINIINDSALGIENKDSAGKIATTFGTANLKGNSTTERASLDLNAGTNAQSSITGTKVNLQGYTEVSLSGAGKIEMGVDVTGLDNHIEKDTSKGDTQVNLGTITTANGSELYTAHLKQGTDFDNITGGGMHYDEGSDLGDITATSDRTITESADATFDKITVSDGVKLIMNTTDSDSSYTQNSGNKTVALNGASTLKLNENYSSSDTTKGHGTITFATDATLSAGNNSSVYNDKGGASVTLPAVSIAENGTFNTYGALQYAVNQNGANTLNVNGKSTESGAVAGNTTITKITTSGDKEFTVKAQNGGDVTINSITKGTDANTNLVLDATADTANIAYNNTSKLALTNGDSLTIKDNGSTKVTMTGLNVSGNGTGVTLNATTTNDESTFGKIDLSEAVLNVTGLTSTNHEIGTVSGTNTINAGKSTINGATITSTADKATKLTIVANDTTSGNGVTLADDFDVTGVSGKIAELVLNADKNNIANSGTISLNGNAKLTTSGTNNITGLSVDVTGTNEINNSNSKAVYTGITLKNGATLTTTGINANGKDLYTVESDVNTIKMTDASNIGNATIKQDATLNLEATSSSGSEFGTITLVKGTGTSGSTTTLTTLNLTPTSGNIEGTSLDLNGNSETNIKSGSKVSLTGGINVSGTGNTINNYNSNTFSANAALTFDASNAALTLNSADSATGNFEFNGIEANQASELNVTKGNLSTGIINFDTKDDSLTLNVSAGTTTISEDFANADDIAKTIILNADGGTINKTSATILNTGDKLTLDGTTAITLGNATVNGTMTVNNAKTTIGDATIGGTLALNKITTDTHVGDVTITGAGSFDTSNGTIDSNIDVDSIKNADSSTGTWSLDFDQSSVTTDTIKISDMTAQGDDKVSFSIDNIMNYKSVIGEEADYFVKYINIANDNDNYVLNSTTGANEYIAQTDGKLYYSYVDNSQNVENHYYDKNTIRVTNYNIDSDRQIDYLTRQGERTYQISGGVQYQATGDLVTALPNMGVTATAGVDNIYTLKSYSSIDGRASSDGTGEARTQLFTIDTTGDNVERTFNLNGGSLNNALSDSYYFGTKNTGTQTGHGAAITAISGDDADSAATNINLNPHTAYVLKTQKDNEVDALSYPDSYIESERDEEHYQEIKDVAFIQNNSTSDGGAVYAKGKNTTITTTSATDKVGIHYKNNNAGCGVDTDASHTAGKIVLSQYYADADGGAVYLTDGAKYISEGKTTFTSNSATGNGGALYNDGSTFTTADTTVFDSNETNKHDTTGTKNNDGGAVYNTNGATYTATGDTTFKNNTATGAGGALYNSATVTLGNTDGTSTTTFSGNTATSNAGALYNNSTVTTNGTTVYSGNTVTNSAGHAYGGALVNEAATYTANGDTTFTNNQAIASSDDYAGMGGAITNYNSTVTLNGTNNFANNVADYGGGALYNTTNSTFKTTGNTTFTRNIAGTSGGAIANHKAVVSLGSASSTTSFINNEAGKGGAVYSYDNDFTTYGNTNYKYNTASASEGGNGGAIALTGGSNITMNAGKHTFTNNKAAGKGGAIYLQGVAEETDPTTGEVKTEAKSSVIHITANNTSVFEGNQQNAVFATAVPTGMEETLEVDTDCGHVVYKETGEHYTESSENNAVYLDGNATLELETTGNGVFKINDKIASNTDSTDNKIVQNGTVYYNNDMSGYNGTFNLNSGTAHFNLTGGPTTFGSETNRADYILNGGSTLDVVNGSVNSIYANSLDLSGTSASNPALVAVDLNLTTETADSFNVINSTSGYITVSNINVSGDSTVDYMYVPIVEAADGAEEDPDVDVDTLVTSVTSPNSLYEYDVSGTTNGLVLTHTGDDTGALAPQVAINARLAGQLDLLNDVLHRVDQIAENRYFNKVNRTNLYAADPNVIDDRHIDNGYTPYVNQEDGGNLWVKGNATIEHNSPDGQDGYKNRMYNAFIGYETPVATLKNGWDLINTVFGGYQGSYQDFDNIENYQNGGSGGYMANLYHNNFFAGGVVMMGGTNVDVKDSGKYGRDMNFGLFDIAGSARAGYNVGMGNHWLFQPMLTASYIYITGLDRGNAHGDDVYVEGTNTIQIAPGFKIVGNYNGWKPYVLFDYTWPIIANTKATINDADLPDVGLRSYVEYGVGLRKDMGERFTGHVEAVMRNGGRTGMTFQGGLVFKF